MKKITVKEMVAQMLIVGIPSKESIDGVLDLIKNYGIGGVILYRNNYRNLEELKSVILKLKNANKGNRLPLTISIDQEGGRVNRLPLEFVNSYSLYKMAKNSYDDIRLFAKTTSKLLADLGINMNFAPVLDLKMHGDNHAIGNRAISSDVNKVSEVAYLLVDEFNKNNVVPVVKHFPGQGSVNADSHFVLPIIRDYNKVLEKDSISFKNIIEKGIDTIMVGHILIMKKTGLFPATLSKKFINNELRKRYNYKNIVITDELGMRSVSYLYGKVNSIVRAYRATNDIICCKYSNNFIEKVIDKVINKVDKGIIDINDISDSYKKIKKMKEKFKFNDNVNFDNINVDYYNKIITKLKEKVVNKS